MSKTTTKAVEYLRVSGRGQVDGDGFTRQADTIGKYAAQHGVEVVDTFRDEGVSGTTELDHRDGLAALLDRIESNGVRLVLVERADRLARDLLVSETILARFRDLGVSVIEADGGNDLTVGDDDPTRVLIRQVLGAVAQFDKTVTVLKLRAARERVRRSGRSCEGRKPFGHTTSERDTLDRIRELRRKPRGRDRLTWRAVADQLTTDGHRTRTGADWNPGTLLRIARRAGIAA